MYFPLDRSLSSNLWSIGILEFPFPFTYPVIFQSAAGEVLEIHFSISNPELPAYEFLIQLSFTFKKEDEQSKETTGQVKNKAKVRRSVSDQALAVAGELSVLFLNLIRNMNLILEIISNTDHNGGGLHCRSMQLRE